MAQRQYRISLKGVLFPMLSEQQGRTIIGKDSGEGDQVGNTPGVAYCHNVMPSAYGLDSVGFLSQVPAIDPAITTLTDVRVIYGDDRTRIYLAWDTLGVIYALITGSSVWIAIPATSPVTGGAGFSTETVTVGTVNGISYIFYSGIGAFTYNETTNSLDSVTLTGLDIPDVLGVVASSGYLISYTDQAIAWSSTIDPTDFVPSTVTGAGGGNIAGIGGPILFMLANPLGIIIYTATNALAGTYTGNTAFPFKFREIDDSEGGLSLDLVAHENNSSKQYAYSKAGLQSLNSQRAEVLLPDLTDFIAGKRFEDFNETTKVLTVTDLTATMKKKIKFIAARYLVISYGITSFTHALVYDLTLRRLGKLKIDHVDVFEYLDSQTEISKENIGFLLNTGEVKVLDFSTPGASTGVVILGKLQFSRSRMMTLQRVRVENIGTADTLTVSTRASLDGKNPTSTVVGALKNSGVNVRDYVFRSTAINHSLLFIGKFNLVTVIAVYNTAGRIRD